MLYDSMLRRIEEQSRDGMFGRKLIILVMSGSRDVTKSNLM